MTGLTSEQFADHVAQFVTAATGRVLGPGHAQYSSDDGQAFEAMTPLEIIAWAREEVQDLANYAAMLDIQLSRLAQRLEAVEQ